MSLKVLTPLSWVYRGLMKIHSGSYALGLLKVHKLPKPVVSVGNLSFGGSGKTPMVDFFLGQLEGQGKVAAVLTRGYGRSDESAILRVRPESAAHDVGDEPLWLKQRHPQSQIIVGKRRYVSAKLAQDCDLFILEDGFQHWAIKKDLEIVLVDASVGESSEGVFPLGLFRESYKSLERAHWVILTKTNLASPDQVDRQRKAIAAVGVKNIFESKLILESVEGASGANLELAGQDVFLISGVGNPASFEKLVAGKHKSVGHLVLRDHAAYGKATVEKLRSMLKSNIGAILMTEKDAVKWRSAKLPDQLDGIPLGVVKTRIVFLGEVPDIHGWLQNISH